MSDAVNHPAHYQHATGVEAIVIVENLSFCLGNALKYLWRAGKKGDAVEDLRKALWYVRREQQTFEERAIVRSAPYWLPGREVAKIIEADTLLSDVVRLLWDRGEDGLRRSDLKAMADIVSAALEKLS